MMIYFQSQKTNNHKKIKKTSNTGGNVESQIRINKKMKNCNAKKKSPQLPFRYYL